MKKMVLFGSLNLLFFALVAVTVFVSEGTEIIIMVINSISIFLLNLVLLIEEKKESRKEKNKKIYRKIFIAQNAMIMSLLSEVFVLTGSRDYEYSDWTIMMTSITLITTMMMYIAGYREVNKNDKLKEILELKGDSIIKKLYDFYYITIGIIVTVDIYYLTKLAEKNYLYMEIVFVLTLMAHVLQISFLKKVIKE